QEVPGNCLGDEWKGHIFRITGGNKKQGFLMKQGVLLSYRVRLLLADSHSCYHTHHTERKRKGENDIPGMKDNVLPNRLGPKRATKIRSFFNLGKEDDVWKDVVRRGVKSAKKEDAKPYTKAPKIQRLVTPLRLQRRRHLHSLKHRRIEHQKEQKAEFEALLSKRVAEKKAKVAAIKAAHKTAA
ncbi:hypothetical protein H0H87_004831, partial [Tephrocybe sp. NHM501043]